MTNIENSSDLKDISNMRYIIYRAIEGVSINGKEYLLNDNKSLKEFSDEKEVQTFIEDTNSQGVIQYETIK